MRLIKRKSSNLFELSENSEKIDSLEIILPDFDISEFGAEFLKFKNLKELFIQSDILNKNLLPRQIGDLESLEKLYILNFNYYEFPNWVFKLKNVKHLMLRGNDIKCIPKRIEKLSELKSLRIENCELTSLSDSILNLNKLRKLSLSDNSKLTQISINNIPKNLKVLNLVGTSITEKNIKKIKVNRPQLKINKFVN